MFDFLKSKTPKIVVTTPIAKSLWRNNMWVMTPKGIGILFQMGIPCVIHTINDDGTTAGSFQLPIEQLRQATWAEIPEVRRMVSKERGAQLGYI